jgi:hypothetical protein
MLGLHDALLSMMKLSPPSFQPRVPKRDNFIEEDTKDLPSIGPKVTLTWRSIGA